MTKIALFWHIGLIREVNIDITRKVIERQFGKIMKSGILMDGDLYIGIINKLNQKSTELLPQLNDILNRPNIHLLYEAKEGFECPTLGHLHQWCTKNDGYVGYMHSKGTSRDYDNNIHDWTELLEWCTLEKYKDSVKLLAQGYDTVGCNHSMVREEHYSGNFWWASSDWIKNLIDPTNIDDRHNCGEMWILGSAGGNQKKHKGNHYCIHDSGINHYNERYPRSKYA